MFWIGGLKINGIEAASSVGIGSKLIMGARTHAKVTSGNATVRGDHASLPALVGWLNDPDLIDMPVFPEAPGSQPEEEG